MKKVLLICAFALSCTISQSVKAQGFLDNILGGIQQVAQGSDGKDVGNAIGNIISSVVGDKLTTQASLLGDWTYSAPCVQFESGNLLTQAGGVAIATKCENKLAKYYKTVGIKPGTLKFSFAEDGKCTYSVGKKTLHGTFVFDQKAKTVVITTSTGQSVKAYVTITGPQMSLCFDGNKALSLFTTISSKFSSLSSVSALAGSYDGMKVGFKFGK